MDGGHALASTRLSIMERVTGNTFRCIPCDEFNGLHYTINDLRGELRKNAASRPLRYMYIYLVLDTRVFTLSIFTNEDSVNIVIRRLVALYRNARPDIGKQVERSTKCQIKGDVTLSD